MNTFKHLLDTWSAYKTEAGSLLDHAFAMWTSHVSAGPSHGFSDLPIIIAGNAGGYLKTGQYINANGAGNNRLLNTLITAAGVPTQNFGQGTAGLIHAQSSRSTATWRGGAVAALAPARSSWLAQVVPAEPWPAPKTAKPQ